MQKREEDNTAAAANAKAKVEEGESPAKRSRHSPALATPLTGAREEPRQEQRILCPGTAGGWGTPGQFRNSATLLSCMAPSLFFFQKQE